MKRILTLSLVACLGVAKSAGQEARVTADSIRPSPEFEFIALNGERVSSSSLKGKVIVLDFWSSDCTPCRKSMPQLEQFHRRYRDDKRVAFYFVNSGWETLQKAEAFASSKKSSFLFFSWGAQYDLPFAYDNGSTTLSAFGLDLNPSTIIIDARFQIRVKHSGYIDTMYDYLNQHVEQYLAER